MHEKASRIGACRKGGGWWHRRHFAVAVALATLFGPTAAQPQAQPKTHASFFGSYTACGDKSCPPHSDPRQRENFVLRLQTLFRMPAHQMPGGFGEAVSAQWIAQQQKAVAAAAAKDPVSWLGRGAGEAHSGRYAAAQPLLQQALELALAQNDALAEAASLANLGVVAAMLGRYDDANSRMDAALQKFRRYAQEPRLAQRLEAAPATRLPPGLAVPPATLAAMQAAAGMMMLEQELNQAKRGVFLVLLNQGSLAAHLGQLVEAESLLQQAERAVDPGLEDGARKTALGELQLLYRTTGRKAEAASHDRRAAAASPGDDERAQHFISEVALSPAVSKPAVRPSSNATAVPVPAIAAAPQPPADRPLPPATQRLKDQIDGMIRAAGQQQMAQIVPSLAACEGGVCRTPGDPTQRSGYVLRLAGVAVNPMAAAALGRMPAGIANPTVVNAAGVRLAVAGRLDAALAEWTRALQGSSKDPQTEAAVLTNLGVAAAMQGRPDEARNRWAAALGIYDRLAASGEQALKAMGAMKPMETQLAARMGALNDRSAGQCGQLLVSLNLAHLEAHQTRQTEADGWLRKAGDHARRGQHGMALVYNETAAIDRLRGRPQAAADNLHRARVGSGDEELWQQVEVGFLTLPSALPPLATVPVPTPHGAGPLLPTPSRPQNSRDATDPEALQAEAAESVHARLADEAGKLERAGDVAGALAVHARAAVLAAATDNFERERSALAALQRLRAARGEAGASIFHGKRVSNAVQRQRQTLTQLSPGARRAFLQGRKQSYVLLAQTLLDRNRLPEAEHVLRLLKEDEGQQLELGTAPRGTMPLSVRETLALQAYGQLTSRIRPLETRRATLTRGLSPDGPLDSRGAIERARLRALNRADEVIATFEANAGQFEAQTAACRVIVAKKSRTSAESEQLAECALSLWTLAQTLGNGADSVRALKRDASAFTVRPTEVEARQIDAVLQRYAALQSRLARVFALARELPPAPAEEKQTALATFAMALETGRLQELWALQTEIDELSDRAAGLDAGLEVSVSSPEFTPEATAALESGLRLLKALPPGTLALYYLQGDDRLDILVVGAGGWHRAQTKVSRPVLAARIAAMRTAVSSPRGDAVATSQALYALLVAPVEDVLRATRVTTLMVALEGPLRYVPFAALHDGRGWLVERYAISLYTTAAPTSLTAQPARQWRVAAFGNTERGTDGPKELMPLPGVRRELQAIVRETAGSTQGVMEGEMRLDGAFTAQALRDALRRRPNVVHIASHFVFKPDDAAASFVLLGNDEKLTLAQLGGADFRFDQIDLVTLSACDTALVAANGFGQEVEALGTLLQSRGAAAVLSTLWPVADDSTAQFMRRMYQVRQAGATPLSRAQALRSAQLAFIGNGSMTPAATSEATAGERGAHRPGAERQQPALPYSHPYYWAPFVLMGNWL